jgi:sulfite reductase alpha subunit-like flavoprotein
MDWLGLPENALVAVDEDSVQVEEDAEEALPAELQSGRPVPLSTILTHHLDIRGRPNRYFFELLAHFSASAQEVGCRERTYDRDFVTLSQTERLREFLRPENQDQLYDYCYRVRRTCLEVLSVSDAVVE